MVVGVEWEVFLDRDKYLESDMVNTINRTGAPTVLPTCAYMYSSPEQHLPTCLPLYFGMQPESGVPNPPTLRLIRVIPIPLVPLRVSKNNQHSTQGSEELYIKPMICLRVPVDE